MNTKQTQNLSALVESYTEEMYSWAYSKVSDPELAKDLVQDTFLVASEKMDTFEGKSSLKTWLFAILKNKIIDFYRKKVNQSVRLDNQIFSDFFDEEGSWNKEKQPKNWGEDEQHLLDNPEFQDILQACLEALPDNWNTAVKLKYLLSKNGQEICQELGISQTNYWQIIHRAKLRLRDCIENNWFNA